MTSSTESSARSRREAIKVSALAATDGPGHGPSGRRRDERPRRKENPGAEIKPRPEDVGSMEAVIKALYDTISGPAGPRDWNRLRSLFLPGARLIPSGRRPDGSTAARVLSVEDFIKAVEPRTKEEGFFESEIHRRVERFGAVAHVFSTYESRHAKEDESRSCGGSTASSSSSTASGGGSSPSSGTPNVPISRSPPSTCRESSEWQ